jgi:hypothetical protein
MQSVLYGFLQFVLTLIPQTLFLERFFQAASRLAIYLFCIHDSAPIINVL